MHIFARTLTIFALVAALIGSLPTGARAQTESPDAGAPAPPPPMQVVTPNPDYGASVFLLGNPETTDRDLQLLKAAGIVGALAIGFLLRYLQRQPVNVFVWYRLAFGAYVLAAVFLSR